MKSAKWWIYMIVGLVPAFGAMRASGATATVNGLTWTYTVSNGMATVNNVSHSYEMVIVPSMLGGYPVTGIGDEAFFYLTSITIPASVTNIGNDAFSNCGPIEVNDANPAFASRDGILFSKDLKNLIHYPGGRSGSYVIPSSVTNIGNWAFSGSDLTSVTIPSSVTSIGECAFTGCRSLARMTIPASVKSIGAGAFFNCDGMTQIQVDSGNPFFASREGLLFSKDLKKLIQCPVGKRGTYTIPTGVTSIGDSAFYWCSELTSVIIPTGVTSIGEDAFSYCYGLTSVTIPFTVTNIGNRAFFRCQELKGSMAIPSGMTSIGDEVFYRCEEITNVTIPTGVTRIGNKAFSMCTSLTSVTIPASVTNIGTEAFSFCDFHLRNITIPSGDIGNSAFWDCLELTNVTMQAGVTCIGNKAFSCCYGLTSVTIPSSVTSIGADVFEKCDCLKTLFLPISWAGTDKISHFKNLPEGCTVRYLEEQRVVFDASGGMCDVAAQLYMMSLTYGWLPTPTRERHAFAGWWTAASGGTQVAVNSAVTKASTRTLYAHWTLTHQEVRFEENGGLCSTGTKAYAVGKTYGSLPTATRTGYSFEGWWTAVSGGTQVTASSTVTMDATRTLYAHWRAGAQTVTFNANGGNCATSTKTYTMGGSYTTLPTAARAGYEFEGWWTAASGGTQVTSGSTVTTDSSRTLHAHWMATHTVEWLEVTGAGSLESGETSGYICKAHYWDGTVEAVMPSWTARMGSITAGGVFRVSVATSNLIAAVNAAFGGAEASLAVAIGKDPIKWQYSVKDGEARVEGALPASGALEIPFMLDGWPVTSIGDRAFLGSGLASAVIGDHVRHVGDSAFSGCGLQRLYVPASWKGTSMLANAAVPGGCKVVYRGAATETTPVAVPCEWLELKTFAVLEENGGNWEEAAKERAANGMRVWECYLAGVSTTNAAAAFKVKSIEFVDGKPVVTWDPDLNEGGTKEERVYTVEGAETLGDEWGATNAASRFFRVKVGMPGENDE